MASESSQKAEHLSETQKIEETKLNDPIPAFDDEITYQTNEFEILDDEEASRKTLNRKNSLQQNEVYFLPFYDQDWWDEVTRWVKPVSEGKVGMDKTFKVMEKLMKWNLQIQDLDISKLKTICNGLPGNQIQEIEEVILPCISKLVLRTEEIFKNKVPYLMQNIEDTVELTKEQAACLLANMFYGTLRKQKNKNLPI